MLAQQGRQVTAQDADGQAPRLLGQVTHNALTERREKIAAARLVMLQGLLVAPRRTFPARRLRVMLRRSGLSLCQASSSA